MSGAGIWGGVFYVVSGALIFATSSRRFMGHMISALTLNVISFIVSLPHLALRSISIMSWKRERFGGWWGDDRPLVRFYWREVTYVPLFSISTILAYIAFGLTIWAVFLLSEAIYWQRLKESKKTFSVNKEEPEEEFLTTSVNHALATASIKANAVLQALFAFIAGATNIAVIFVVVWGLQSRHEEMNQTVGTAIMTAPFFFVLAHFGFTAGRTGSNKPLVTFLCLSVFCCLISFLEGGGPAVSLANRVPGMWVAEVKKCKPDPWGGQDCEWVRPENKDQFFTPLVAMNSVILCIAFVHFLLSIWGIVIASKALWKDGTCVRCCGNCFVGRCDMANGDCCADACA